MGSNPIGHAGPFEGCGDGIENATHKVHFPKETRFFARSLPDSPPLECLSKGIAADVVIAPAVSQFMLN
jgi:hypothetical protein